MNNIYIIYYILISLDIINEVFIAKVTSYEDSRVGFSFVVQTVWITIRKIAKLHIRYVSFVSVGDVCHTYYIYDRWKQVLFVSDKVFDYDFSFYYIEIYDNYGIIVGETNYSSNV